MKAICPKCEGTGCDFCEGKGKVELAMLYLAESWPQDPGPEPFNLPTAKTFGKLREKAKKMAAPSPCEGCRHQPRPGDNYQEICCECSRWYADRYAKSKEGEDQS